MGDVRPCAPDVFGHLRYFGPNFVDEARSPPQDRSITKPVGKSDTRTEVGKGIVGNFPSRVDDDVSRQCAITRDARSEAPHIARRRQFLNDISAVAEVNVACFDSALLTYGGVGAVRRHKGTVIAEAEIKSEFGSGLPRVLDVQAHQAAGASCLVHISTVSTIGNIEQKGT